MKFVSPRKRLERQARRGFRGYPVATVAFYGPDGSRASKAVVAIVPGEDAEPAALERWFSERSDVRNESLVAQQMLAFIEREGARRVVVSPELLGCPHEDGVDYPLGAECPRCPYWQGRDRWSGAEIRPPRS